MAIVKSVSGDLYGSAPASRSGTTTKVMTVFLVALYLLFVVAFINRYSVNWPIGSDNYLLIDFYDQIRNSHTFTLYDFFQLRIGSQPDGMNAVLAAAVFSVAGINYLIFIWMNVLLPLSGAIWTAATVIRYFHKPLSKALVWLALPAAVTHPFQAEHLFVAASIGWMLTSAIVFLNVNIIERTGRLAIPLLFLTLFAANFSSAQGSFLWLTAAAHLLMKNGKKSLIWSSLFVIIALANFVWLAILRSSDGNISAALAAQSGKSLLSTLFESAIYFVQISGAAFSLRDPVILFWIGAATLFVAAGTLAVVFARRRVLTQAERIGFILIITSLAFLAMFTAGRMPLGLPWALWEMHMSPLLVPMLAGVVLIAVQVYDRQTRWSVVIVAIVPVLYLFGSILISLPEAANRAETGKLVRLLARHSVCVGSSRYLIENTNLDSGSFDHVMAYAKQIPHLCEGGETLETKRFVEMPSLFNQRISTNPEDADALHDLWEVYQTHWDLIRAQPLTSPESPLNLVRWARYNALANTPAASEKLKKYQDYFQALDLMSNSSFLHGAKRT